MHYSRMLEDAIGSFQSIQHIKVANQCSSEAPEPAEGCAYIKSICNQFQS